MKPKVSIIVPIYNCEKYLDEAIQSLLNQSIKECEFILVNDGSTDNSLNIANEYKKLDSRIKIINQVNQGVSVARNTGIEASQGEYIGFIDGDDWIEFDMYKTLYDIATKNNLDLIIKNDVTPVMIQADGRHLWRVFDNLMNNINKYAQPGTRVYIDIIPKDSGAIITFKNVSATPLNISSDELKERFVRGDSSRNTEGSGLGLSIAESLMKLMNGTLELIVDGDLFKVTLEF